MISRSSQDPRDFLLPGLRNLLRLSLHTRFLSFTLSSRASRRDTCILCTFVLEKYQLWLIPGYKVREVGAFDPHVYTHLKSCCSSRYMYDKVTSR